MKPLEGHRLLHTASALTHETPAISRQTEAGMIVVRKESITGTEIMRNEKNGEKWR
jgi:hypothetical protein